MWRRDVLTLLLGLGSVGGCLRFQAGGPGGSPTPVDATSTPTPTADPSTATPKPTTPTADQQVTYPPGLEDDDLSPLLADAHTSSLATQSFTIELRHTEVVSGDRRVDSRTTARADRALRAYRTQAASLYSTSDQSVWRRQIGGDYIYGRRPMRILDREVASYNGLLRGLLSAGRFDRVTMGEQNGTVRFTGTASEPAADATRALPWWIARDDDRIETFAGEAVIRPSGIIERLSTTIEVVRNDSLEKVRTELSTSGVGSTRVAEPSWVGTATENVPQIEAALLDGRRFLPLDHTGGVAIPPGAQIDVHGDSEAVRNHVTNDDPIAPGERVWLWRDTEDVYLERGSSRPAVSPEPFDASGWLEIQYGRTTDAFRWTLFRVDFADL